MQEWFTLHDSTVRECSHVSSNTRALNTGHYTFQRPCLLV
jgi:hypothetical protein